jgi:uncharacterized phage-associated protein
MNITFEFQYDKAIEAMAYIVDRYRSIDKVKLMKLMYIADKDSFLAHGVPITGDRQCAMPYGPVPSACLKLINGEYYLNVFDEDQANQAFKYFHVEDHTVFLRSKPKSDLLTDHDQNVLDAVMREHGDKGTWVLVRETHQYPEYKAVYVENTSTTIPYELMLKNSKDPKRFRHGRPVISQETMASMSSPFCESEPDL